MILKRLESGTKFRIITTSKNNCELMWNAIPSFKILYPGQWGQLTQEQ